MLSSFSGTSSYFKWTEIKLELYVPDDIVDI